MSGIDLKLNKGLIGCWYMDVKDKDSGVMRDASGRKGHGQITSPLTNYFGDVGNWKGDVEQLGSVDGFNNVGKLDATANDTFEDLLTNEFKTSDFSNSGDGYYVYLAIAGKTNNFPDWNASGTFIRNPSPDPQRYKLWVLRSDGQNFRDEYFRLLYDDNDSTSIGRFADPFVWTEDEEGPNARIISGQNGRTVEPFTQSPIGDAFMCGGESRDINVPETNEIKPTKEVSMSFWFRPISDNTRRYIFLMGRDVEGCYLAYVDGGDIFRVKVADASTETEVSHPADNNVWQHGAFEYQSGSGGSVWYNGSQVGTLSDIGDIEYNDIYGTSPTVGSHGGIYHFNGSLSNVRVYNRAISAGEIQRLYNARNKPVGII